VVTLDFEARSMEYLELLLPVFTAILAIFVAVFAVVFFYLQQRWGSRRDTETPWQQKEKSVILS
jgi:hypothetical protein